MPVEDHVRFEKVKTKPKTSTEAEKPAIPQIDIRAALEKRGIPTGAPPKKENMLSKLRNTLRRNIATTNRSIMTLGGAAEPNQKTQSLEERLNLGTSSKAKDTAKTEDASKNKAAAKALVAEVKKSELQAKRLKKKLAKSNKGKNRKDNSASSSDDDDGDKSCDFDDKFSDNEGVESHDENDQGKDGGDNDFGDGDESDPIVGSDEDDGDKEGGDGQSDMSEGAAAVQRTMKNVLNSNARNMGAPSDADFGANAGADSDDENESLASEFEEEENIVRSNVG